DELLAQVARRLAACVRPMDTVARFGGDEFTVLLRGVSQPADARRVADRMIEEIRRPFTLSAGEVRIGVSVGIALGQDDVDTQELIRRADAALYQAKQAGKGRALVYGGGGEATVAAEPALDLRQAIAAGDLRLYYQPEVDLESGAVIGVEALVRWQHPTRGLVLPGDFIADAEESGAIIDLGAWVLDEACRQAALWRSRLGIVLVMSVNLSPRQFQQPDLVRRVREALDRSGLPADALRLEITETAAMQRTETTLRTLRALRALGVRIAIDDFGTGYSSLAYLRTFQVDTLKIDRSFVASVDVDGGTLAIIEAVTSMARALGIDVTAEGIETESQLRYLRALQCHRGQGYLFAEPLPGDEALSAFHRRSVTTLAVPAGVH
ncbi:MAG: bifunctional diguanylate cyclase/phosphodiesterase, partial [Dehalococcoidia bacterium]